MKKVALVCLLPFSLLCFPEIDEDSKMLASIIDFDGSDQHGEKSQVSEPEVMQSKRLPLLKHNKGTLVSDNPSQKYVLNKFSTDGVVQQHQIDAQLDDQTDVQRVIGSRNKPFLNKILSSSEGSFNSSELPARKKAVAAIWERINRLTSHLPEDLKNMLTNPDDNSKELNNQKKLLIRKYRAMVKTVKRLNDRYITGQIAQALYEKESSKIVLSMQSVIVDMQVILSMEFIVNDLLASLDITQDQLKKIEVANQAVYQQYLDAIMQEVKDALMTGIVDSAAIEERASVQIKNAQDFLADQIAHNEQMDHLQKVRLFQKQFRKIGQKKSYTFKEVQMIAQALSEVETYMQLENSYKIRNEELYIACGDFQYDVVQWIKKNTRAIAAVADQVVTKGETDFVGLDAFRFSVMSLLLHDSSQAGDLFYQKDIILYRTFRKQLMATPLKYISKNNFFGEDGNQLQAFLNVVVTTEDCLSELRNKVLMDVIAQKRAESLAAYQQGVLDDKQLLVIGQELLKAAGDNAESIQMLKQAFKNKAPIVFDHLFVKKKAISGVFQKFQRPRTSSESSINSDTGKN